MLQVTVSCYFFELIINALQSLAVACQRLQLGLVLILISCGYSFVSELGQSELIYHIICRRLYFLSHDRMMNRVEGESLCPTHDVLFSIFRFCFAFVAHSSPCWSQAFAFNAFEVFDKRVKDLRQEASKCPSGSY